MCQHCPLVYKVPFPAWLPFWDICTRIIFSLPLFSLTKQAKFFSHGLSLQLLQAECIFLEQEWLSECMSSWWDLAGTWYIACTLPSACWKKLLLILPWTTLTFLMAELFWHLATLVWSAYIWTVFSFLALPGNESLKLSFLWLVSTYINLHIAQFSPSSITPALISSYYPSEHPCFRANELNGNIKPIIFKITLKNYASKLSPVQSWGLCGLNW